MTVSLDRRVRAWVVLALSVLFMSGLVFAAASPAAAKHSATTVRLGLTGMITSASPEGTWSLNARPGQTLGFVAGFVPGHDDEDGNKSLAVQVSVDAEHLPGGAHGKALATASPYNVTLSQPGRYPLHWSVAFVLDHGHKSVVEATRDFNATILVAGSPTVNKPGVVKSGGATTVVARMASPPSSHKVVAAHQTANAASSPAAQPLSSPPPTFALPPDPGLTPRANSGAITPLPATPADSYLFTAIVGTLLIGFLWLLWVASIKPILGR